MAVNNVDLRNIFDEQDAGTPGGQTAPPAPGLGSRLLTNAKDSAIAAADQTYSIFANAATMPLNLLASGVAGIGGLFSGIEQPTLPQNNIEKALGMAPKPDRSHPVQLNLDQAMKNIETVQGGFRKVTGPYTPEGERTLGNLFKPFEWLDKGAQVAGDKVMDMTGSPTAGALTATAINASPLLIPSAVKGVKAGVKGIKEARDLSKRMRTIPERGLEISKNRPTWEEVQQANPGMSQGELLRKYPAYKDEALRARSTAENAPTTEAPATPATPAPDPTFANNLTPKQRERVSRHVAELGSVEAVKKAYPKADSLGLHAYAQTLAQAAEDAGIFVKPEAPVDTSVAPVSPAVDTPLGLPEPPVKPVRPEVTELPSGPVIELGDGQQLTKARDKAQKGVRYYYHGTMNAFGDYDVTRGDLGVHFGTKDQAAARTVKLGDIHPDEIKNQPPEFFENAENLREGANIRREQLNITKAIRVRDITFRVPREILTELKRVKALPDEELAKLEKMLSYSSDTQVQFKAIRNMLLRNGVDALLYPNKHEGKGMSVIALDPEKQVVKAPAIQQPADEVPQVKISEPAVEPTEVKTKKPRTPNQQAKAALESSGAELMTKNGEEFWKVKLSNGKVARIPAGGKNAHLHAQEEIAKYEQLIAEDSSLQTYASDKAVTDAGLKLNPRKFDDIVAAKNFMNSAADRLGDGELSIARVGNSVRIVEKPAVDPFDLEDDISLDDAPDIDTQHLGDAVKDYEQADLTYGKKIDIGEVIKTQTDELAKAMTEKVMSREERLARIKEKAEAMQKQKLSEEDELKKLIEETDTFDEQLYDVEEMQTDRSTDGDYYDEVEVIEKRSRKTIRDLTDIFSDERGAVGKDISKLPKHFEPLVKQQAKIAEAERELKATVAKTQRIEKQLGEFNPGVSEELVKVQRGFKDILKDLNTALGERGAIGEQPKTPAQLEAGQRLLEDLNRVSNETKAKFTKAKKAKRKADATDKQSKGVKLSQEEVETIARDLTQDADMVADAFFTKGQGAVDALVAQMKLNKRIVPRYKKGSFKIPDRQIPFIPKEMPELLDDKADLMGMEIKGVRSTTGHVLTPSFALRPFFKPGTSPIIDAMESIMSLNTNVRNAKSWKSDVFGEVKTAKADIDKVLTPLYNRVQKMMEVKDGLDLELNRYRMRYKDARKLRDLNRKRLASIKADNPKAKLYKEEYVKAELDMKKYNEQAKAANKRRKQISTAIKSELFGGYDKEIMALAQKHPVVRITLAAGDKLPLGITLSETEAALADTLSDFFEDRAVHLRKNKIATIESRSFMSHMFGVIATDKWATKFKYEPSVPTRFKFKHQRLDSRIWYPDLHVILDAYIPLVERKLAFQPFLDRWSDFIEYKAPTNMRAMMVDWMKANLYRREGGFVNAAMDGVVAVEYARLVAFSLSIALKHATKLLDTFATNTVSSTLYGAYQTAKLPLQAIAAAMGIRGTSPELELFKAYVSLDQMVKLMDEGPGLKTFARGAKLIGGSFTTTTEMIDNGVTIFANALASKQANLTTNQATQLIWDAILRANFRGGPDMPLYMKTSGGRAAFMFQTTRQKVTELRLSVIKDFVRGGEDAYGKNKRFRLLRYMAAVGAVTFLARQDDVDILPWFVEPPWVQEFLHGVSKEPGYAISEPKPSISPVIDLAYAWGEKGVKGIVDHYSYSAPYKYVQIMDKDYPTPYYDSPLKQALGLRKIDAGHKAEKRTDLRKRAGRKGIPKRKRN